MRSAWRPRAVGGRPGAHFNQGLTDLAPIGRIPDKNVVIECAPARAPAARPAAPSHRG